MTTIPKLLMIAAITLGGVPLLGHPNVNEGHAFKSAEVSEATIKSETHPLEAVRVGRIHRTAGTLACVQGCGQQTRLMRSCKPQSHQLSRAGVDLMDTSGVRLIEYRRLFRQGQTPTAADLVGNWRGVNRGIVELVGYKQFIKEIKPEDCGLSGDNIMVEQVSNELLRSIGWQVKADAASADGLKRKGKFAIRDARGIGPFKHGVIFDYRKGNNQKMDPVRLIVDRVVKIDDNHLLGRATANFGPLKIPLAYFVLERIDGF